MGKLVAVALALVALTADAEGSAGLPAWIEPNVGQADPSVQFIARGGGITLAAMRDGSMLFDEISVALTGSRTPAAVELSAPLPAVTNYLIGDAANWHAGVRHYAEAVVREVYDGIDLVYRADGAIQYDFVVRPGGDPRAIRMKFAGADSLSVDESGDLVLRSGEATYRHRVPVVYQESGGTRVRVAGRYALARDGEVSFRLGAYDPSRPVIIDPTIVLAVRLGGSADWTRSTALDANDNLYLVGASAAGTPKIGLCGGPRDGFIAKLNSALVLQSMTYVGGTGEDYLTSVAVDRYGSAYACGYSRSTDFPTAGTDGQTTMAGVEDAVVMKFNTSLSALEYSYYIGGSEVDDAQAIAVNSAREVFLTGTALSADFPSYGTCAGNTNAWVAKLDYWGRFDWINCYGGDARDEGTAIALDPSGRAVVAGFTASSGFPISSAALQKTYAGSTDAFVMVIETGGSRVYSTYWGGEWDDTASAVAVDASGRIYVAGTTRSTDLPNTPPGMTGYGAFLLVFMTPATLVHAFTIAGYHGRDLAIDSAGCAYLAMETDVTTFADVELAKYSPSAATIYRLPVGGNDEDRWPHVEHSNATGYTYFAGMTKSPDFPATPQWGGTFVMRIDEPANERAVSNVVATATASNVTLTWDAVPGATMYGIHRRTPETIVSFEVPNTSTSYIDTVTPDAYLYWVRPIVLGVGGFYSRPDLAVVFPATDDPAVAQTTTIKAAQLLELRTAVDKARALAGLAPYSYTYTVSPGSVVRVGDFSELQFAINEARLAAILPRFSFTSLYLPDTRIRATHLNELRQSIR